MTDKERKKAEELLKLYEEFTQTDRTSNILEYSLCVLALFLFLATLVCSLHFDLVLVEEKNPFVIYNFAPFASVAFIWGAITFFSTLSIHKSIWRTFLASSVFFSFFFSLNFYANLKFNVALKNFDVLKMQDFKDETSKSSFFNFWFVFDERNVIQRIDEKIQSVELEKKSEDLKKLEAMKKMWEGK